MVDGWERRYFVQLRENGKKLDWRVFASAEHAFSWASGECEVRSRTFTIELGWVWAGPIED